MKHKPASQRTQNMGERTDRRMGGLEALRCVAAFCVLLLHTRAVYGGTPVFGRGYLGVDFFLMLSGFLMARIQEPRLATGAGTWHFLRTRYQRLWPLMALGGVIGLPMQFLRSPTISVFARVGALNLALLPAPDQFFAFPLNIPAWAIFAEFIANAAHVLLLRHLRGAWLWLAILIAGLGMMILLHHEGSLDLGAKSSTLLPGLARCLFAYMLGMGLGRWWKDAPVLPVPFWLAFIAMPVALVAGWKLSLHLWWLDMIFVIIICPLMLAGGMRLRHGERLAGWVGKLAFPLFAWQMPILQGAQHLGLSGPIGFCLAIAGGLLGIFVEERLAKHRARTRNLALGKLAS